MYQKDRGFIPYPTNRQKLLTWLAIAGWVILAVLLVLIIFQPQILESLVLYA